jgi:16S rRNA processing protein RimM
MIEVMKIVNTHGVRGDLKAIYYADSPDFFEEVTTLYDKNGKDYKISNVREHKGAILFNVEGIDDMTTAERLKNTSLYARREDFPPLPEGEYYLTDLIGLTVVSDGEEIGSVSDIIEKAQNLIVVKKNDGTEALVPQCDAFVKKVSLDEGKIYIEAVEGLL